MPSARRLEQASESASVIACDNQPIMKNVPMSAVLALIVAGGLVFVMTRQQPAAPGQGTLEQRVAALESGHLALQQQIQQLQAGGQNQEGGQAAAPAAPRDPALPAELDIAGAPALGPVTATLTMVEFSDFECPFCGRYQRETFPQLKAEYIDSGKIRYVFRHFPLTQIHPRAMKSAEAAECAHRQGKFWPMHDRLFANQQALADDTLVAHAQAVGLNMAAFQQCFGGQAQAKIRQDLDEGAGGGVSGTPGFFLAEAAKDGKVRVLSRIVGAQPYANFKSAIDAQLALPRVRS